MKKSLLIVSSGILPVPAVYGGAIENRIEYLINRNEQIKKYDITVFSIYDRKAVETLERHCWKNATIQYTKISFFDKLVNRLIRFISHRTNKVYFPVEGIYVYKLVSFIKKRRFDKILIENMPDVVPMVSKYTQSELFLHLGNDVLNDSTPNSDLVCSKLKRILVVSNYIKKRVCTIKSLNPNIVKVVPQGTDISQFLTPVFSRKQIREKLGIRDDEIVFVFCGRIDRNKGIKEALSAYCLANIPNSRFVIIGAQSIWDNSDAFSKELSLLSEELKERIIFTGYVDHKYIPSYYKAFDIAVLTPIWQEAGGNTIVEAVAAGLPLITTLSGGNADYCNKDCAFLLEIGPNLTDKISDAMVQLVESNSKRTAMAEAAKLIGVALTKERHSDAVFSALDTN